MTGNGPFLFDGDSTDIVRNPNSWTKLGHVLYVDQPVGTGFSTASKPYPVKTQERVTDDFYKWLKSFLLNFPHLRSKNVHLIGESYAGIYIPYFAAAIAENQNSFHINLRSMSLGDGTWGNAAAMSAVVADSYLEEHKSTLKVPDDIVSAFTDARQTCGFDVVLEEAHTYPPAGKIMIPGNPENMNQKRHREKLQQRSVSTLFNESCNIHPTTAQDIRQSILHSTCYGPCAAFSTAMDYLTTASKAGTGKKCFDMYDITNGCDAINDLELLNTYFSRADVQTALNIPPPGRAAPAYDPCTPSIQAALLEDFPTPPAYSILPSLTTDHSIALHAYSGYNDFLVNHIGTELSLQNLTWRGERGFSRKPDSPFYVDDAAPVDDGFGLTAQAGIWGEERGTSYHLFWGAGHSVFKKKPREMFAFVRDMVVAKG